MTAPTVLLRRSVMAAATAGGLGWLSGRASSFAARRGPLRAVSGPDTLALSGSDALAALCADLAHAHVIGAACLRALPETETSEESLARLILTDTAPSGAAYAPAQSFTHIIRARGRDDFRNGRIVVVDGWILSLTETRLYALAALLSQTRMKSA
jgi:hypothetical protein